MILLPYHWLGCQVTKKIVDAQRKRTKNKLTRIVPKIQETPQDTISNVVYGIGCEIHGGADKSVVCEVLLPASVLDVHIDEVPDAVRVERHSVLLDAFADVVGQLEWPFRQRADQGREEQLDSPVRQPTGQLIHTVTITERVQELMRAINQLQTIKYPISSK